MAGNSVRGDDDLMDDDLTFRTIDPCHPGTCLGIPLRWSKIFWFHGKGYGPVAAPDLPVPESAQQRRMCFLGGD